jgi:phosphotransacetylase
MAKPTPPANPPKAEDRFRQLLKVCQGLPAVKTAVVHPCSRDALTGAVESAKYKLIDPILVGPKAKIEETAKEHGIDISGMKIEDVPHSHAAAERAVELCRKAEAAALMKGSLHTDELMHAVLDREHGLRTGRRVSHAFVMAIENYHKPFVVTDAAINIYPDLLTLQHIVQNAIDLVRVFRPGDTPKVAILSAVETVNPAIESTINAAALTIMAKRGQITNGIVDGPLAYDNAFSLEAAESKGIVSDVAGDPDIFVVPDLEAGNILAKQMVLTSNAISAGIVLGARVPIVLTSRSEGAQARIASSAVAMLVAHRADEVQAARKKAA